MLPVPLPHAADACRISMVPSAGVFRPPPGLELEIDREASTDSSSGRRLPCGTLSECSTSMASSGPPSPAASATPAGLQAAGGLPGYVPGHVLRSQVAGRREPTCRLSLEVSVPRPTHGTCECPTVGSAGHWAGICRPCEYVHKGMCTNGAACKYCHLCGPEVSKLRRREKRLLKKTAAQLQRAWASAGDTLRAQ